MKTTTQQLDDIIKRLEERLAYLQTEEGQKLIEDVIRMNQALSKRDQQLLDVPLSTLNAKFTI